MGKLFMAICILSIAVGGKWALAQTTHHVVGGDRGWDADSDLASWSELSFFRVGDKIWFTYSAAQENIVELKNKEEYEACDVSNPIRMFTGGLDVLTLKEEGIRYFASGKGESCKNGLKIHVEVQSQSASNYQNTETSDGAVADGPTTPSASAQLNKITFVLFIGLLVSYFSLGFGTQYTMSRGCYTPSTITCVK